MATRFAVATGNWSNTAIWDSGALPVAGDTVYPNNYTVTIDQDINIASLNNNVSNVYLPNMAIPAMTGNTQPSGVVNASDNLASAYLAFDQDAATFWNISANATPWISYQFPTTKVIKRYYWTTTATAQYCSGWIFQGSNDGTTWANIETVTGHAAITYTSGATVAANTTAYLYYRMNITSLGVPSNGARILRLEMTESVGTTYGATTGGSFTVPSSLSGTRNIVQSGAGIISNNSATVMTLAHTSGNTVNFNVQSGGYIFNPNNQTAAANFNICSITGTGITNFNSDIWGTQTIVSSAAANGLIVISNAANVTINGNCYGTKINNGAYNTINLTTGSNSAILNINGNLLATNTTNGYTSSVIYHTSLATVNITGILTGDIGLCYYNNGTGSLNVLSGTVTVTNANSFPAIYMTNLNSLLTFNGSVINKNNVMAISAFKMRLLSTSSNPSWTFQTNGVSDIALTYGTPSTGPYPSEADVRYNTPYGASPTRYGTLRVPLPQYVSQGVLTDNTVGTAYLSATDVWNVLTSSITTSGSIGERLKNASTVQTNGDQLAAYIV